MRPITFCKSFRLNTFIVRTFQYDLQLLDVQVNGNKLEIPLRFSYALLEGDTGFKLGLKATLVQPVLRGHPGILKAHFLSGYLPVLGELGMERRQGREERNEGRAGQ